VGIVLLTVPLAAVGIFPGLVLTDSPFGFQPLLGVIALVGIVVNNAIVLIDLVDQQLSSGASIKDAVSEAVARRTRPILLTTCTTIGGLLPLAFSSSTLWPPMAWAIISGLLASTLLTLVVVPSVCRLWLSDKKYSQTVQAGIARPGEPV
jgi:multidrug efflux pump subunit AcrB